MLIIWNTLKIRQSRERSNRGKLDIAKCGTVLFLFMGTFTPFLANRNECFCEFGCFNYECDEKNEIQLFLFWIWDMRTLSCCKNQLHSFVLASSTCSQICLAHRLHKVLLTGNGMMMIEGTRLPCRVVRLAGGVRSPPGVGGANEPSWAT